MIGYPSFFRHSIVKITNSRCLLTVHWLTYARKIIYGGMVWVLNIRVCHPYTDLISRVQNGKRSGRKRKYGTCAQCMLIVAHNIYTPALSTPVNILRRLHIDIDDRTVRLAFLLFGFGFIGVGTVHSRVTQGNRHNCISLVDMVGSRIPGGGAPDIVSL